MSLGCQLDDWIADTSVISLFRSRPLLSLARVPSVDITCVTNPITDERGRLSFLIMGWYNVDASVVPSLVVRAPPRVSRSLVAAAMESDRPVTCVISIGSDVFR